MRQGCAASRLRWRRELLTPALAGQERRWAWHPRHMARQASANTRGNILLNIRQRASVTAVSFLPALAPFLGWSAPRAATEGWEVAAGSGSRSGFPSIAGDALGLARGAKLSWAKQQALSDRSALSKWQGQLPSSTIKTRRTLGRYTAATAAPFLGWSAPRAATGAASATQGCR
jgi:hypothetical protein